MATYLEEIEEKDFMDLLGNEEFEKDLKSFFQGGRYTYSDKEIEDTEKLANDFVQHMRWQNMNESTAIFDLNYVKRGVGYDADNTTDEGLLAFGKLMNAYDKSDGGGTGVIEGAWDYFSALAASPSTAITVGTFGFGVGSKLLAKAASKATQMSIRKYAQKMLESGIAKQTIKEGVKTNTVKSAALKAGGISFVQEGTLGGVGSYGRGETKEEVIEGYEYGLGDLALDATIDGTLGTVLGGFSGAWTQSAKNKAMDMIVDQAEKANIKSEEVAKVALDRIKQAQKSGNSTIEINETMTSMADLAAVLRAKNQNIKLDKLPEDQVALGREIFDRMLDAADNTEIAPGLDMNAIRGIAAASIEMREVLKVKPGQRITEAVSEGLENGSISNQQISEIRKRYNLTAQELSYVWMAELSRAGSILAEGSKIKKAIVENIDVLSSNGASVFTGNQILDTINEAKGKGLLDKSADFARNLDGMRIAFMTSQLGTTAANVATGVGNTFIDMSDAFWKDIMNVTLGVRGADGQVQRRWTGNTLSILKGFTVNKKESEVLSAMLMEDAPAEFTQLFYESQRIGDAVNSNSLMSKAGRFFNTLNMATDSVFKQGSLYGAVDRRLRELNNPALGRNFKEYLEIHTDLEALRSSGILSEATDYAKRFTFQRDYRGDNSLFGRGAQEIQRLHKQYPFVISSGLDMPFPRYLANHLEYINDYTPIGIVTGGMDKLENIIYKNDTKSKRFVGDMFKTGRDRTARQMTGTMLTMGGVWAAVEKGGEIDYSKFDITGTGDETNVGRVAGPWAANLLIGDWIYRSGVLGDAMIAAGYALPEGMPTTDNPMQWGSKGVKNVADVLGGMTDLNFDLDLLRVMGQSIYEGNWTEEAQKKAGNIFATFTYPGTIARDVAGQLNPDVAGSPFTRDVRGGPEYTDKELEDNPELGVSMFGERNFLLDIVSSQTTIMQATRFMMDMNAFSLTQSNRKKEGIDLKKYSILTSRPTGSYNPIARQFGFNQEPPSTDLQKEFTKLGINEFQIFNKGMVKNPAVHYATSKYLAVGDKNNPPLHVKFNAWRKKPLPIYDGLYKGQTYDQLTDPAVKERALKQYFLSPYINQAIDNNTEAFRNMVSTNSGMKRAAGFYRNLYVLENTALKKRSGKTFDDVIRLYSNSPDYKFEKKYDTAKDFIGDSSGIEEEIVRRKMLIEFSEIFDDGSGDALMVEEGNFPRLYVTD